MDIETRRIERRLGNASWGAVLLWAGACFVVGSSWGIGLIGVAVVILLAQAMRMAAKLRVQGLWLAVGALFAAAGFWDLLNVQIAFVPVLFVAAGAALLLVALADARMRHQHST